MAEFRMVSLLAQHDPAYQRGHDLVSYGTVLAGVGIIGALVFAVYAYVRDRKK